MKQFHFDTSELRPQNLLKGIAHIMPLITIILTVAVIMSAGFMAFYYKTFSWGEEQKKAYEQDFFGKISFQEERFRQVIQSIEERNKRYQEGISVTRDITK